MVPSSSDTTGDGHDDPTSLDLEDVEDVEEFEDDVEAARDDADDAGDEELEHTAGRAGGEAPARRSARRVEGRDDLDLDEDDGLAPEAGRRRPSVLSLLLLVAGAI